MAKVDLHDYLRQIDALIRDGRAAQAMIHCQHVLCYFPQNVEAHRLLGLACFEQGQFDQAADALQRVLSADPEDFTAHATLAAIHQEGGRAADVVWHLERAYELEPNNPTIQARLQEVYGRSQERPALTRGALARLYFQGELYDQAIAEAQHLLAEDSERVDLQSLLAEALWRDHQRFQAVEVGRDLLDKLPNSIQGNALLAEATVLSGQAEEALVYLQRLQLLVQPDLAHPTGRLARLYSLADAPPLPDHVLLDEFEEAVVQENSPEDTAAWTESIELWLAGQGQEVAEPEPIAVSSDDLNGEEDELPEWLREVTFLVPAGSPEPAAAGLPAWLPDWGAADSLTWPYPNDDDAAGGPQPAADSLTATELPNWLADFEAAQAEANEPQPLPEQTGLTWWPVANAIPPQTEVEVEVETDAWPGWLDETAAGLIHPAAEAITQPAADPDVTEVKMHPLPDDPESEENGQEVEEATAWLDELAAQQSSLNDLQSLQETGQPPDWLEKELEGEPASEEYLNWLQPEVPTGPADVPTWLEPPPNLTTDELTTWQAPAAEQPEGEAAAVVEDLSWLDQVAAGEGPALEEPPTLTWLDEDTPEIPLGIVEAALPATGDTLEWLDEVSQAPTPAAQPSADIPEDPDAVLAWLEQLATLPEEPVAVTPGYVEEVELQPLLAESWLPTEVPAEELVAAEPPGFGEDILDTMPEDPDEAMAWLEQLAAQQGTGLAEPELTPAAEVAVPDWLALDEEVPAAEPLVVEIAPEEPVETPVLELEPEAAVTPEPESALEVPVAVEVEPEVVVEPELEPEMVVEPEIVVEVAAEGKPVTTVEVEAAPIETVEMAVEEEAAIPAAEAPLSLSQQASQALAAGQFDLALSLYEQQLNQNEDMLGLVAELETAVAQNQGQPLLRRLLGDAYLRNGRLQEALDMYRLVLEQL
ncbi:MAG: tetratricopeptide repeat protein [Chloroflexota bacterium]